tara:strand:+ start:188 stop:538 length:351 start_codon:yes stop_codon:yes gene_type:complete
VDDLGKTIRIIRQAKGIKLSALAKKAGVSPPFLSLVEGGERQPSLKVLRNLAKELSVPSEALILMSVGNKSELKSSDEVTTEITKSVGRLIRLEEKLEALLKSREGTDEPKENHPG